MTAAPARVRRLRRWRLVAAIACLGLAACASRGTVVDIVHGTPAFDRATIAGYKADRFVAGRFTASDGTVLPYRLLVPDRIEPGKRYPLVVQFHNSGGIGSDNRLQVDTDAIARSWALPAVRARHPAFVIAPQFATRSANYDDPEHPAVSHAAPPLATALELVASVMAEHPVDRQRVYAVGYSMGGSTTWQALLAAPTLFAAGMPVSGIAPDRAHAAALAGMPLLVLHGDADPENPIDADRAMVAAIRAAGGRSVRMREYVGLEHDFPGDLVPGDWWRDWLFAQHRSP